jgi:hypothetical protein
MEIPITVLTDLADRSVNNSPAWFIERDGRLFELALAVLFESAIWL